MSNKILDNIINKTSEDELLISNISQDGSFQNDQDIANDTSSDAEDAKISVNGMDELDIDGIDGTDGQIDFVEEALEMDDVAVKLDVEGATGKINVIEEEEVIEIGAIKDSDFHVTGSVNEDLEDLEEVAGAKSDKSSEFRGINELNKYKLLTREEEQELGKTINNAFDEMLKCVCTTSVIRKHIKLFVQKLQDPYTYNEVLEEYINIDGHDAGSEMDLRLLERVRSLLDNFLHEHGIFKKRIKISHIKAAVLNQNIDSIPGITSLVNAFKWTNLNKHFVLEVVNDVRNIINGAMASYNIIEKNRENKKKKDPEHQLIVEKAEEELGFSFGRSLEFVKYLNNLFYTQNQARNTLALSNLRLVGFVASSFKEKGVDYSYLVQHGCLGLLIGILRFDFRKDTRLCTYVSFWIRQSMSRGMQKSKIINVPSHLIDLYNKFKKAKNAALNLGLDLSDEEIALNSSLDYNLVRKAQREIRPSSSLDKMIGDSSDQRVMLEEVLSAKSFDPMEMYTEVEKSQIVGGAFIGLPSGVEASYRIRSLNSYEAAAISKTACSVNNSSVQKYSKQLLLMQKLGAEYDSKTRARCDVNSVHAIKKYIIPTEIDIKRNARSFSNGRNSKIDVSASPDNDVSRNIRMFPQTAYGNKIKADLSINKKNVIKV